MDLNVQTGNNNNNDDDIKISIHFQSRQQSRDRKKERKKKMAKLIDFDYCSISYNQLAAICINKPPVKNDKIVVGQCDCCSLPSVNIVSIGIFFLFHFILTLQSIVRGHLYTIIGYFLTHAYLLAPFGQNDA